MGLAEETLRRGLSGVGCTAGRPRIDLGVENDEVGPEEDVGIIRCEPAVCFATPLGLRCLTMGDFFGFGGYGCRRPSSFFGSGGLGMAGVSSEKSWTRRGGRTTGLIRPGANRTCRLRVRCTSELCGSGEGERAYRDPGIVGEESIGVCRVPSSSPSATNWGDSIGN